ncbi:MAG TPA: sigma-E factor negative regulatory protein [Casimicrobiaceae bacterium]|jgi:sigma-E factor negative regulatory protein RseA
MNEKISRFMDGELDEVEIATVLSGMKSPEALHTWACYHAIGDTLRRDAAPRAFACGVPRDLAQRLASEPTVVGARRTLVERTATWAWAAAATIAAVGVVGWTAFSLVDETPAAVAKARQAGSLRAAQVRELISVPSDYLVAHQEYSPSTALQVVGPYLRAAAVQGGDIRR